MSHSLLLPVACFSILCVCVCVKGVMCRKHKNTFDWNPCQCTLEWRWWVPGWTHRHCCILMPFHLTISCPHSCRDYKFTLKRRSSATLHDAFVIKRLGSFDFGWQQRHIIKAWISKGDKSQGGTPISLSECQITFMRDIYSFGTQAFNPVKRQWTGMFRLYFCFHHWASDYQWKWLRPIVAERVVLHISHNRNRERSFTVWLKWAENHRSHLSARGVSWTLKALA